MTGTIRRGTPPRRRQPAKRKVTKPSIIDRLVALLPFSETTLRMLMSWMFILIGGAAVIGVAQFFGVPAAAGTAFAEGVGRAGFKVEQIEVTGLKRMDRMTVMMAGADQQSLAMPLVDLEAVRAKLVRYGWVADAHVSRRLPDTLLIEVVERTPAAVWQQNGELTLIDAGGVPLEKVRRNAIPGDLPLVIGPGANLQEPARQALLAAAPALAPRVANATWVGNRRWNIQFDSGETLALPEGDSEARAAFVWFAEKDGADRLLGRGLIRFDMRDPTRLVTRRPGHDDVNKAVVPHQTSAPIDNTQTTAPASAPGEGQQG